MVLPPPRFNALFFFDAIAVTEVAAVQRQSVSMIRNPLGDKTAFTGALVGCGAISGLATIWLVRQVSPASRL